MLMVQSGLLAITNKQGANDGSKRSPFGIMRNALLVRLFGHTATLIHGDTMVIDRWRWLKKRLPVVRNSETFIDIGCGSGAFTIGAAKRGYESIGLTFDPSEQNKATERAEIVGAGNVHFEVFDIRRLDTHQILHDRFDTAICFEAIEHILDDTKLMADLAHVLRPGGTLLLTTPNRDFRSISGEGLDGDSGIEDGGHVRKGYTEMRLRELCSSSGLLPVEISYCSGFLSQKITGLLRKLSTINYYFAWLLILPLRLLPLLLDPTIQKLSRWPGYSICLVAKRPTN